ASSASSPRPLRTVASGLAMRPPGSQLATPIRTDPTSTASLMPGLKGSGSGCLISELTQLGCGTISRYATRRTDAVNNIANRTKRLRQNLAGTRSKSRASALGDIVTAATAAAENGGRRADHPAGGEATSARAIAHPTDVPP